MMENVTIPKINEKLKNLSEEKLLVAFDFISYLEEKELHNILPDSESQAIECMHASEQVLARDWNLREEDEAWENL